MALGSKAFRCRGPLEVRLDRDRTCALLDFPPADVDEGRDELAAVLGVPHAVAYAIDDEQRDLADAPGAVRPQVRRSSASSTTTTLISAERLSTAGRCGRSMAATSHSRSAMVATTPSARGAHCER